MLFSSKHFPVKERVLFWKSCTWKTVIVPHACVGVDALLTEDIYEYFPAEFENKFLKKKILEAVCVRVCTCVVFN